MKILELSGNKGNGLYLSLDDDTYALAKLHKWHLHTCGSARATMGKKQIYAHHFIMGKPKKGYEIDHINLNKLDNRRENLRETTIEENRQNKLPYKLQGNRRNLPKGVYKTRCGRYQTQVRISGKTITLGNFLTPELAHNRRLDYLQTLGIRRDIEEVFYAIN